MHYISSTWLFCLLNRQNERKRYGRYSPFSGKNSLLCFSAAQTRPGNALSSSRSSRENGISAYRSAPDSMVSSRPATSTFRSDMAACFPVYRQCRILTGHSADSAIRRKYFHLSRHRQRIALPSFPPFCRLFCKNLFHQKDSSSGCPFFYRIRTSRKITGFLKKRQFCRSLAGPARRASQDSIFPDSRRFNRVCRHLPDKPSVSDRRNQSSVFFEGARFSSPNIRNMTS